MSESDITRFLQILLTKKTAILVTPMILVSFPYFPDIETSAPVLQGQGIQLKKQLIKGRGKPSVK
jgi:hypothetical protein